MRIVVLLLLFLLIPGVTQAQTIPFAPAQATNPSDADIDALVRIIENDESRAALIERLQQGDAGTASAEAPASLSIARQLAEYTRAVAEGVSTTLRSLIRVFVDLQHGVSNAAAADFDALRAIAMDLGLVVLGLFGGYLVLRLVGQWMQGKLERRVAGRNVPTRLSGLLGSTVIELAVVLLAWTIGYGVALAFIAGPAGRLGISQTLLLNAFLVVEITKLVVRLVLQPRYHFLRLLPVTDDNAAYWSFWLGRIIALVGYTFLFVAPVLATNLSVAVALAVQILVMATAVLIGIIIILQNRNDVRTWLNGIAERRGNDGTGQLLVLLGRYWHLVAIAYLVTLLVVWFTNPEQALPFMLGATMQSAIAILAGVVIVGFIARAVSAGLRLPEDVKRRLPLLEARLHAFVPHVMLGVRWVAIVGVGLAIAQAWALFDAAGWIATDAGQQIVGSAVSAAFIVLVCIALHIVVASWVEYRLNTSIGKTPTAREKTLLNLFKNAFTVALIIFGLMLALGQIGVNIAPLLAGAGVVGLAIGFGAQKLVQDIITGIFIQFENVMNEGDVVMVGDKSGVVEKLTIRSVTIRDLGGTVHLIPFSSVDLVSNMMRGFSFHLIEIGVAYDSDIAQVKQAMKDAFDLLMQTEHKDSIIDDLDMHGMTGFAASAVTVRARIKTLPGQQWGVGRAYNEVLKTVFAERGIEIPYPHITYVQGGEARASGRVLRADEDRGPAGA